MTKRDVLSIALKIVGVVFLAQAVVAVPRAAQMMVAFASPSAVGVGNRPLAIAVAAVSLLVYFIVAWVLLARAERVASALVPGEDAVTVPGFGGRERQVFALSLRVVGAVTLVGAVPEMLRLLAARHSRPAGLSMELRCWTPCGTWSGFPSGLA